jgi:hypothetical protein
MAKGKAFRDYPTAPKRILIKIRNVTDTVAMDVTSGAGVFLSSYLFNCQNIAR